MKINIKELGELSFNYGWVKPLNIQFLGVMKTIQCVFDAYTIDDVITPKQISSYQLFMDNIEQYQLDIDGVLKKYISDNSIDNAVIEPRSLLIKNNGDIGLLCDCNWDIESGIVVIVVPSLQVGRQDIFL